MVSLLLEPLASEESTRDLVLELRATDFNGNVAASDPARVQIVPDTFPPQLVAANLEPGDVKPLGLNSFNFEFGELLDLSSVTAESFNLTDPSGQMVASEGLQVVNADTGFQVRYRLEEEGDYEFTIVAGSVTDISGNSVAPERTDDFVCWRATHTSAVSGRVADRGKRTACSGGR